MKRPSWRSRWKGWRTIRNARAKAIQDLGGDTFARYYIGRHLKLFRDSTMGTATPEHVAAFLAAEVVMWRQDQERRRVDEHIRGIGR